MNKKVVNYIRVSSKEQSEGYSLSSQSKFLIEYANKNNFLVVKEFSEAETAKSSGRAEFNKMISFLKENQEVKIVCVEKTDRLYRNFKDYIVIDELDLAVHLVKEGQVLSKDSKSHDKFIHGIKVLMAKNYIDNLSEEARKGIQEKVEQGGYPHLAPIGYKNNKEKHTIEIEENGARLVKALFELYATGAYSLWTLRKKIIEEGLIAYYRYKKIPASTIARILASPVYYGMIPFKGKLYPGTHEPLVNKELFDKVNDILTSKAKTKGKKLKKFTFMDLMVCANCTCAITAEIHKGKYIYYHCTNSRRNCSKKYIREAILAPQFEETLKSLNMDDDNFLDKVKSTLKQNQEEERKCHEEVIDSLQNELKTIRDRLEKAYLDKIDGKISEEFWQTHTTEWEKQQEDLIETIGLHEKANLNYLDCGIRLLEYANEAYDIYLRKNNDKKRELFKIIQSNSKLNGSKLDTELKRPFSYIPEAVKSGDYLGR